MEAIATRLEVIASTVFEAIASRLEAIALRFEAITLSLGCVSSQRVIPFPSDSALQGLPHSAGTSWGSRSGRCNLGRGLLEFIMGWELRSISLL